MANRKEVEEYLVGEERPINDFTGITQTGEDEFTIGGNVAPDLNPDGTVKTPSSPITTSEPSTGPISGVEDDIAKTEEEMTASEERYANEQTRRDEAYTREQDRIKRVSEQRQRRQEQAGKAIIGESRAALAELGILSTEPGLVSATSAQQYLDDVKVENQKEMDRIMAEEVEALQAARDAKESGDFTLANQQFCQAQSLRGERNKIRMDAMAEARAIRADERAGDTAKIQAAQEARAAKKFDQETAENVVKYMDWNNMDQYNPQEIDKLEKAMGLPKGTLEQYAEVALRAEAMEGWTNKVYTDKSTGKVTSIYSRLNPETGKPQYMEQDLGFVGERYKPTTQTEASKTGAMKDEFSADKNAGMPMEEALNIYSAKLGAEWVYNQYGEKAPFKMDEKEREEAAEAKQESESKAEWEKKLKDESDKYERVGNDVWHRKRGKDKKVYTFKY